MRHRNTAPVLKAQAPALPPAQMAVLIPPMPPAIPLAGTPVIKLNTTAPPEKKTETAATRPPHSTHHHSRPAAQEATKQEPEKPPAEAPAQPAPTPQVASVQPPEASPIGQLSTANDNTNIADRHAVSEQIDSTENGLNAIKRSLSSAEQKTATQIRTFIARARDALKADDLDGARTLSTKAHLLLEELTKE